jgi:hypothetical protein
MKTIADFTRVVEQMGVLERVLHTTGSSPGSRGLGFPRREAQGIFNFQLGWGYDEKLPLDETDINRVRHRAFDSAVPEHKRKFTRRSNNSTPKGLSGMRL